MLSFAKSCEPCSFAVLGCIRRGWPLGSRSDHHVFLAETLLLVGHPYHLSCKKNPRTFLCRVIDAHPVGVSLNPLRIPGPPVVCRTLTGRRRDSHPARQPQAVLQAMRQAVAAAGRSVMVPPFGIEPAVSGRHAPRTKLRSGGIIEAARTPCGQSSRRTWCGGCVYRVAFPALPMVSFYTGRE